MALEGWARRQLVVAFGLAVVALGAGLWWSWALVLPVGVAVYLLGLGLWPHVARHFSRRLGLRALIIVPTSRAWLARLLRPAGIELVSARGATFDLHVDTHVWHADVDAFGQALQRDCERLSMLLREGAFGADVVFVVNTFNRRLLAAVEQTLGARDVEPIDVAQGGAVAPPCLPRVAHRRRGFVLQRESADAHTAAFLKRVQLKMFGRVKEGERGREDVRAWDVVVIETLADNRPHGEGCRQRDEPRADNRPEHRRVKESAREDVHAWDVVVIETRPTAR